jgi:hypothetical protein
VAWELRLHHEVEAWYLALCESDPETADLIEDAIDQLAEEGPALGRPLADRVKGSRYHNMKELRPPSAGSTEIRMLFAFDPGARPSSWSRATSSATGMPGTARPFR